MPAVAPTETFAQSIAHRYTSRLGQWPAAVLVLKRAAVLVLQRCAINVAVRIADHRSQVNLAPRLALKVLSWPRAAADGSGPRQPQPRLAQQAELAVVRRASADLMRPREVEQLVRRLVAREERIEILSRETPPQSAPSARRSSALVLDRALAAPLVVRRPPAQVGAADEQAPASDTRRAPARPVPYAAESQEHTGLAPIDLNRLTDQVIQAIDRRVIAHRERTGRI